MFDWDILPALHNMLTALGTTLELRQFIPPTHSSHVLLTQHLTDWLWYCALTSRAVTIADYIKIGLLRLTITGALVDTPTKAFPYRYGLSVLSHY